MKATFLLIVTNFAVMLVLGLVLVVLQHFFGWRSDSVVGGVMLAAVVGFGGAIASLLLSKKLALMSTGARVVAEARNSQEFWLLQTVERQARAAGVKTPELAIYDTPEPNAFATGANRNAALVAVSTGLLSAMTQDEVEAVVGHEISHVANGDMVTLTLIQGVVNTFVIYLSRAVGLRVAGRDRDGRPGPLYYVVQVVLQLLLGALASLIVAWFSRRREFRADAGGGYLAGKRKMVAALKRLQTFHEAPEQLPRGLNAFGIRGRVGALFASHPPLPERIAALEAATA